MRWRTELDRRAEARAGLTSHMKQLMVDEPGCAFRLPRGPAGISLGRYLLHFPFGTFGTCRGVQRRSIIRGKADVTIATADFRV
jgi:hypothetical protein